ncbi:toll/interleukin-1 receptor domain-containing protein [Novosphingobium sp. CECT 9465]|uniref:toll/interleukin-1 receptor domain-containing protein n=1 Tax=Novosphingobium sp. CECT 9465 TaxID=2829794 RepID=UPI001E4B1143|nr:toll/interleukin-1 receptor domain-containing protein [Novosphingobium sp. CECT 9465]CAH0497048.1 hypothetical protein NVSP9465_02100 [Novosphingobium sp. CECT 9465]
MKLLEALGSELQRQFTFDELDLYLSAARLLEIAPGDRTNCYGSKRVYAKNRLASVSDAELLRLADDLDLGGLGAVERASIATESLPPRNWKDTPKFKLFISHISKHKNVATRLRDALKPLGVAGFVAHEDIHPTARWQAEIERGLATMDALIAILTPGFRDSVWTNQEIGFALGRGVKIISLRMGEDPPGFISTEQAIPQQQRMAVDIAPIIVGLLSDDERTTMRMVEAQRMNSSSGETP